MDVMTNAGPPPGWAVDPWILYAVVVCWIVLAGPAMCRAHRGTP